MKLEAQDLSFMFSKQNVLWFGLAAFLVLGAVSLLRNNDLSLTSFFSQDSSNSGMSNDTANAATPVHVPPKACGINMNGAEFGPGSLPGKLNTNYLYPNSSSDYQYFANKHQTIVRIPFRWERVQNKAMGSLSAADIQGLKNMVAAAKQAHQKVILDLHNYGAYYNQPLHANQANELADVWQKLATTFKNDPTIYGYELMNEPHDMPDGADGWAKIVQTTVNQIRKTDTQTPILVPGYDWQQAQSWPQSNPHLHITDPSNKIIYAAHQYFDTDHTGTYSKSFDSSKNTITQVKNDSQPFLTWLKQNNAKGIFTEYGVPGNDSRWFPLMDAFMENAFSNSQVVGVVYWGAGPWWGSYQLSVEPANGKDKPQMATLVRDCS